MAPPVRSRRTRPMQTVLLSGRSRRALMLIVAMQTLSGCATTTGSNGATSVFCASAKPIQWDDADTDETIRQAKAHNAVGKKLCGWG